jgi:hypothetical protein
MTTVFASTSAEWRAWLAEHSRSATEAWLVIFHEDSRTPKCRRVLDRRLHQRVGRTV